MNKYFKHKLKNLLVINKIVVVHYAEIEKNFTHQEESHDFWEVVFVEKKNIFCTSDQKKINVNQGEMIFHKPNEKHALIADGISSPSAFICTFECRSDAMRFFENKVVKLNKNQIKHIYEIIEVAKKTFDIPTFDPELKKMQLLTHPTLGGEQLIKLHLELLLIDLMRSMTETEYGNKIFLFENELGNKFVSDVISILKDSIYSQISIEDICKKTSYSKAYVFKQFKLATGKSVMEYYTDLKMKEAKKLLKDGELSVKEVADKLCYDTPNYFTKSFKKINKMTPTEYKKRVQI